MDSNRVASIALELCDLFQLQLDSIMGRKLTELAPEELEIYHQKRTARIAELRSELHQIGRSK